MWPPYTKQVWRETRPRAIRPDKRAVADHSRHAEGGQAITEEEITIDEKYPYSHRTGTYHQRSNVESVFSMVKRKFGDGLRSKTLTALNNEALAKLLCHNLEVLVHEMYELGIAPEFGGTVEETAPDEPRILRFPGA